MRSSISPACEDSIDIQVPIFSRSTLVRLVCLETAREATIWWPDETVWHSSIKQPFRPDGARSHGPVHACRERRYHAIAELFVGSVGSNNRYRLATMLTYVYKPSRRCSRGFGAWNVIELVHTTLARSTAALTQRPSKSSTRISAWVAPDYQLKRGCGRYPSRGTLTFPEHRWTENTDTSPKKIKTCQVNLEAAAYEGMGRPHHIADTMRRSPTVSVLGNQHPRRNGSYPDDIPFCHLQTTSQRVCVVDHHQGGNRLQPGDTGLRRSRDTTKTHMC